MDEEAAKLSRSEEMVDSPELTAFQQIQAGVSYGSNR